jgi:hypothetical protein
LAGAGSFLANGGTGGNPGGGGRIAIYYNSSTWTGSATATGYVNGTVIVQSTGNSANESLCTGTYTGNRVYDTLTILSTCSVTFTGNLTVNQNLTKRSESDGAGGLATQREPERA